MTVYNWLSLLGIPGLLTAVIGYILSRIKKNDLETQSVQLGVQALLRDRLIQSYKYHSREGYCEVSDRDNWINMYTQYHNLGANGVMDDIHEKFLELPIEKPQ